MKRILLTLGLAVVFAGFAVSEEKEGKKKLMGALKGGYTVIAGEKDGEKEPEEKIKGIVVFFDETKLVVRDNKQKSLYEASYKIDEAGKPAKITLTAGDSPSKGKVAKGLIEKDGDTIKIIYDLNGDQPESFKTHKGQNMFVMKNEHKRGGKMKDK